MVGVHSHAAESALLRKMRKPMIEKKRRDRMNVCIDQIKALLARSSSDGASVVKMDKAEILELAVAQLSRSQNTTHVTSYRAGFRQCTLETLRFHSTAAMIPNPLLNDLDSHLQNVCESTASQISDITSGHLSSATRSSFTQDNRFTSSPMPMTSSSQMIIPTNKYRVFSPLDRSLVYSPIPRADVMLESPASFSCRLETPSPTPSMSGSQCSTDFGYSSTGSHSEPHGWGTSSESTSRNELVLRDVMKEERPWRPW